MRGKISKKHNIQSPAVIFFKCKVGILRWKIEFQNQRHHDLIKPHLTNEESETQRI